MKPGKIHTSFTLEEVCGLAGFFHLRGCVSFSGLLPGLPENHLLLRIKHVHATSVCSSRDELGVHPEECIINTKEPFYMYYMYGLILGVCGLLNTLWGKTCLLVVHC